MTFTEAKTELARRLNIDYSAISTNDLFTDTDLGAWIQLGVLRAWDYKPWPFTQKAKTVTTISSDYYDHPSDLMNGSIFLLRVGGYEYRKVLYQDYVKWFEDNANADDRIWSEWETFIFVNANAYTVGDTMEQFGKKLAPALSSGSDLLPFSPTTDDSEYSGNEAIVQLAYAEALKSEKKKNPQQALLERNEAYATLDILWKPFADSKSLMQSKGRPFFDVPDFFGSNPPSIGNF